MGVEEVVRIEKWKSVGDESHREFVEAMRENIRRLMEWRRERREWYDAF